MARAVERWELGLDRPGSADARTVRRGIAFAGALLAVMAVAIAFAGAPLAPLPQFVTFHAAFVLIVDVVTGAMLLGQYRYRRRVLFAILGCAYLFSGLVMIPFLLSFSGALKAAGGVLGGPQSAVWTWHLWHIVFPALVALAVAVDARFADARIPARSAAAHSRAALAGAVALAALVGIVAVAGHDALPALVVGTPGAPVGAFYAVGVFAALVTIAAMAMTGIRGWRTRTVLHLWLALAMLAMLADLLASLATSERFTAGWYLGRLESMAAASVLLFVFVGRVNGLYRHLAAMMRQISASHARLVAAVAEKDALVRELRESEEEVRRMAYFDPLTELPNRRLLFDRVEQALSQASRRHASMAVLFMDLDRFKEINDELGHDAGDEFLRRVARRLTGCVRGSDTVARTGGDEFVIVLPEIAHPEDAEQVAIKAIRALGEPIAIRGRRLQADISIGIAAYPQDCARDVQELMRQADMAMYAAKGAGGNTYRLASQAALAPQ